MSFVSKKLSLLMSISTLVLLIACEDERPILKTEKIIHPAKIFQVQAPNGQVYRNFPAEVEANATSKLAFRVNGQIIDFRVKAGVDINKGELLAVLDPTDFQLRVDDREARYQLAKSQFEREQLLLEKKLVSQSKFDVAKANLNIALAALNIAKTELEYTHLNAPFNGSIANVMVENHEMIQAKQPVLTLISRDMIDVSIQISENIISRVDKDTLYQPTVIFDSHPEHEFLVSVKEWDTQANSSTLTYKVVFSLPTPNEFSVLPGMSANIRIDLSKVLKNKKKHFLIPVSAIFSSNTTPINANLSFVWLVNPKTFTVTQQLVATGQITKQGVEVLSGIKAGDKIVSAGVHYLSEGMQIKAWNREKGL